VINKNIKSINQIVTQLINILTIEQRKQSLIVFASMIIYSCLELLGVSAIYPFVQLLIDDEAIRNEWYIGWIYEKYPKMSTRETIVCVGLFIILVFIIKNALSLVCSFIQYSFASKFQRETATLMLKSYMKRPYEYFHINNSAIILRGVEDDTMSVYNILVSGFEMIAQVITIIFIGGYIFSTDFFIAISACGIIMICFVIVTMGFKKKSGRTGIKYRNAVGEKTKYSLQAINGIKEIIVLDRRDYFVKYYDDAAKKYEKANITYRMINSFPDRILEAVCIAGFMGIICIKILTGSDLSTFIPTMAAFAMATFRILPSISKISTRINNIVFNRPGLQNCYDNITEVRSIYKFLKPENLEEYSELEKKKSEENQIYFNNEVHLNNIMWCYQDAQEPVLTELSMSIHKGESVAFIGASGAGKTTLADVILGLLHPQSGEILMDGIDVFSIPNAWSKIIGYVPQSVFLIDDTIRANIAFGLPHEEVDDEKIWNSLEQAQLAEYVHGLPNGIDTIVGERGIKFSGGQRQRIAIARALYEDPQILVLDEATSALDNETETAVMEAIDALQGTKTLIIVAHRLTTIRNCDTIYEIVGGKAVKKDKEEVLGCYN